MCTAAAILGAATLAVSFASPVVIGFPVRLSVFAAIVAAVGLLRGQSGRGWIVVAVALTGCVDAIVTWVRSGETGWVLTVVMVLTALQSLAAIGALLEESRTLQSSESDSAQRYLVYAQAAAAYQAYATHDTQAATRAEAQATARAQGDGVSRRPVSADTEQESLAALQARYARHGVGPAPRSRGSAGGAAAGSADPGMPGADRSAPRSQPYGPRHQEGPGQTSSI
jgi:hypothetical protein